MAPGSSASSESMKTTYSPALSRKPRLRAACAPRFASVRLRIIRGAADVPALISARQFSRVASVDPSSAMTISRGSTLWVTIDCTACERRSQRLQVGIIIEIFTTIERRASYGTRVEEKTRRERTQRGSAVRIPAGSWGKGSIHFLSARTRAGTPTTFVRAGTSLVTTLPAPRIAPSPMLTPFKMMTPAPIQTSFPM
jgi:hypothetical protein